MSTRCRADNEPLTEGEMLTRNPHTGLHEDLCGKCRAIAMAAAADEFIEPTWAEKHGISKAPDDSDSGDEAQ